MKKILFPTEFSEHAPEVFKYAVELAYFLKARLVVMHVFNEPEVKVQTQKELEGMATESSNRLLEFVTKHLPQTHQEIKIDYVTKAGFASENIVEAALEEDINLIVMGMTGKTNAFDVLLGSTTLEVLKKADCPVLMIPPEARFEGIDHIAFTTNFEFRDLGGILYLKKWSTTFDAPIHCLHMLENKEDEWAAIRNLNILKGIFKRHKRISFDMKQGDFQKGIESFAKSKRADIVAMMSHKRSFVFRWLEGNEVKGVARRIQIPLLVIKDNAFEVDSGLTEWLGLINAIA